MRSHKLRRFPTRNGFGVSITGFAVLLLLLLAAPVGAFPPTIGRASLDGTEPDYSFIGVDARWLAVDSAHLYWSNGDIATHSDGGSSIGRANLDGTAVDPTFIVPVGGDAGYVYGVTVDSAHVYWSNAHTIGRANLDGTGVDPSFISNPGFFVEGIAVDSGHIYWTNGHAIGRANLNGTGVDPTFINDAPGFWDVNGGLAVDSSHVYWFHEDQDENAWIARAKLDGSGVDPRFIAPGFGGAVSQLAVDSAHLYWSRLSDIARANLDGTGIDASFIRGSAADAVAVDSAHAYWGTFARKPLFRIGKPKRHRWRGTATLPVTVFGPGTLVLTGKGLHSRTHTVDYGHTYPLAVKPKGAKKHRLERRGSVRVRAEVKFTLTGADPRTKSKSLKLIER